MAKGKTLKTTKPRLKGRFSREIERATKAGRAGDDRAQRVGAAAILRASARKVSKTDAKGAAE